VALRRSLAAAIAVLAAPAPAAAWTTPAALPGAGGHQRITYPEHHSEVRSAAWMTVGNVGDVNGDGREDLAAGFAAGPLEEPGSIYVTFSTPGASAGAALGLGGFTIRTPGFWHGLSSAGDVDGDGLGDVAVARFDR
jgi:hypothetical protein